MARSKGLIRNVKPALPTHSGGESDDVDEYLSEELISNESGNEGAESLSESKDDEHDDIAPDEEDLEQNVNNISFGALLQAHSALSRKRKRVSDQTTERDAKLEDVRARLQEIRSKKANDLQPGSRHEHAHSKQALRTGYSASEDGSESDSDSAPSEEAATIKSRSSKHAPATQSTRHQVTRRRNVIEVPKRVIRDPRFDALQQQSAHSGNSEKAYSFLRDYQKAEIAELRAAIKQARNEDDKEILKRKMVSMENRLKSKEFKEREQEVLKRHRKEEKEKIEHGKKPFFLKKKELKERAVKEKFEGMRKKDQKKSIEKRKRRESQKEKKRMPEPRRVVG